VNFEDYTDDESDVEPEKINLNWFSETYWSFPSENRIYAVNEEYIKPLLDEPDYLTFHGRQTDKGVFVLACKVAMELRAIIFPVTIHKDEKFLESLSRLTTLYRTTAEEAARGGESDDAPFGEEIDGQDAPTESGDDAKQVTLFGVDDDTGEVLDGEEAGTNADV